MWNIFLRDLSDPTLFSQPCKTKSLWCNAVLLCWRNWLRQRKKTTIMKTFREIACDYKRNSTLQTVYKTKRKIALYLIFQFYTNYTNYTNVWKLNVEATLKPKKPCQCFIERRNSHLISLYYHCFNEWYGRRLFVYQINLIIEGLLKLRKKSPMEKTI